LRTALLNHNAGANKMKPSKRAAAAPRNRDRKRERKPPSAQLCPDWFYRLVDPTRYFGYSPTQLDEKIRTGQVPAPISLSDSGGRAKGWFGRQIIAWQAPIPIIKLVHDDTDPEDST
jgi:predicted DNA-binding transcriptional regulator AlpA